MPENDSNRYPPHKFVEVEWLDAKSDSAWLERDKLPKPVPVVTRGWLAREEIDYIVLAGTYADGEYGEVIAIPMGMVETITELEV